MIAAVRSERLAIEPAEVGSGDDQRTGVGALEAGDEMEQRRLAGA